MQPLLHVNQLLDFAFHHPADRDVRPLADDLGDVLLVDFLLQHPVALLDLGELRLGVAGRAVRAPGTRPYCSSDALV